MALDGRSKESSGRREEEKAELPCSIELGKLSLRKAEGLRSSSYLARRWEKGRLLVLRQASARFFSAPLLLSSVSGSDGPSLLRFWPGLFLGNSEAAAAAVCRGNFSRAAFASEKASPCTRIAALIARLTGVVWLNTTFWKPTAALFLSHQRGRFKV